MLLDCVTYLIFFLNTQKECNILLLFAAFRRLLIDSWVISLVESVIFNTKFHSSLLKPYLVQIIMKNSERLSKVLFKRKGTAALFSFVTNKPSMYAGTFFLRLFLLSFSAFLKHLFGNF